MATQLVSTHKEHQQQQQQHSQNVWHDPSMPSGQTESKYKTGSISSSDVIVGSNKQQQQQQQQPAQTSSMVMGNQEFTGVGRGRGRGITSLGTPVKSNI